MIPKYTVEYSPRFRGHARTNHFSTDDPVSCEQFLEELLERGYSILGILHEGVALSAHEFDRMVKNAAAMLASKRVCVSLGIKPEEERFRFGFAA